MRKGWRGRALGYLAIADHSRGLLIAHGMNEDHLGRQNEKIRRLNEECRPGAIRLQRAVGMNLPPRGSNEEGTRPEIRL